MDDPPGRPGDAAGKEYRRFKVNVKVGRDPEKSSPEEKTSLSFSEFLNEVENMVSYSVSSTRLS